MYLKHILVILSLAALSLSLQGVTDLTDGNFEELVTNDGSIWLVAFTAEWVLYNYNIVWTLQTFKT